MSRLDAADWFKDNTLVRDLFDITAGEWIGRGAGREVWTFAPDPAYVIKFETATKSFQNVAEWSTWDWVRATPFEKWFAPCKSISACGTILIQRRVEPIRDAERPKRLPAFLCDLKRENFGMLDGRVVCADYGMIPSSIRHQSRKLVPAKWHG